MLKSALAIFLVFAAPAVSVSTSAVAADVAPAAAALSPLTDLLPLPARAVPLDTESGSPAGDGWVALVQNFEVAVEGAADPLVAAAAGRLRARLEARTGMRLTGGGRWRLTLACAEPAAPVQRVGEDESYTLRIDAGGARLEAPTPYGVLRGLETFVQLVRQGPGGWRLPAALVEDRPRFPWRGLLLDSCRHFLPLPAVLRTLDGMAAAKLNVLHWHLTEDQGFRVESRVFPRLHELGSDGLYYTQEQIREVIAYARERGIRVVPEFDVPGHATAWLVGHPELAAAPGPYVVERRWGVFDPVLDPTREEVYDFLDRFLGEMAALFPDPFLHVGGDEVNGVQWNASERVREFKLAHGLKSNEELHAHFNRRLLAILRKHGKSMIGWDEILQPDLPRDAVIQSWRGVESLAQAARGGWLGLLSSGWYLDHLRPAGLHYAVDPHAGAVAELPPEARERILGGEACMWAEFVTPEMLDARVWPRAAAIAERLWSPADVAKADAGGLDDLYRRLAIFSLRLEELGLRHRIDPRLMLQRLADGPVAPALAEFAALLEPVKDYQRSGSGRYTQLTPLNRLVDAVAPESEAARAFGRTVDRFVESLGDREAGGADGGAGARAAVGAEARGELVRRLIAWRQDAAAGGELTAALAAAPALAEAAPLAADLAALGDLGLRALEHLDGRSQLTLRPADWDLLARVGQPRAELLLMVGPHVARLVEAAVRRRP